ncbi:MAG: NAD-dependent epimerase/dehydratase family protein [Thermoplasmata archaeon]|nr:NAD-dependent epimerase/dehydratase family protein [Thermoplasmata archaeon]
MTRVIADQPPIIPSDGTQIRDFVFVDDVVKANLLFARSKTTGEFYVANAKGISINTLAEIIVDMNNQATTLGNPLSRKEYQRTCF